MKQPPQVVRLATSDLILLSVLIALIVRLLQQMDRAYAAAPRKGRAAKNELKELVRQELPAIEKRVAKRNADYFSFEEDTLDAMEVLER